MNSRLRAFLWSSVVLIPADSIYHAIRAITRGNVLGKEKIMVRIPTHRPPTHPGEILLEEFLNPMLLTQRELADAIHVPYQRINDIVNGCRSVTPSTALRLAKFFNMSADFWMSLQLRWEKYHAQ
jgi:addiction module HigA family antidote